jgi:hypothetical protein
MSELRDARLKRALDEAPDASLQPLPRTRDAIRAAAHGAVLPGWKRWWAGAGGPRPWHAAFATVLLAGLITLMWQGEEVPGAKQPAADPPIPAAKAPAPALAPEPVRPQAPPTSPAPVQEKKSATKDETVAQAPADLARKVPAAPAPATPLPEAPPPAAAPAPVPTAPLAKTQPEPQLESRSEPARQREAPAAGVAQPIAPAPAAPPPVMAEAPAAAPQAAPRAQADTSSLRAAAPAAAARRPAAAQTAAWDDWSQVRIRGAQRTLLVERAQAARLAELIARMVRSEGLVAAARGPAILSLELLQGEQPIGTLETDGAQWRWRPEQAAGPTARDFNADAALAAALRQEAERLLRR